MTDSKRIPNSIIPSSYDIFIDFINNEKILPASVTIHFIKNHNNISDISDESEGVKQSESETAYLAVSKNIVIKSIKQNNKPIRFTIFKRKGLVAIFPSTSPFISLTVSPVTIEYQIPVGSNYEGLYKSKNLYITDLEPNNAQMFVPCFDEPCIKSIFNVSLLIPNQLNCISNMPLKSKTQNIFATNEKNQRNELISLINIDNKESQTSYHDAILYEFYPTPPICTYLLCFAVGKFSLAFSDTSNRVPIHLFCQKKTDEHQKYVSIASKALNWLENKFGVKYPLPHLQLISHSGIYSGMENYGLITLHELDVDPISRTDVLLLIHEIVHMWFGDIITIKWWDSLWLNESFAQLLSYYITQEFCPEFNIWEFFYKNEIKNSLYLYSKQSIVPNNPNQLHINSSLFTKVIYNKNCFVMKMFVDIVGYDNFMKFLTKYVQKYSGIGLVDTNDFLGLCQDYFPITHDYFDNWLYKKGFPILYIDDQKNLIQQIQTDKSVYYFPLSIQLSKNGTVKNETILIKEEETNFCMDECDWIIVNSESKSLCLVCYSNDLLKKLEKHKKDGNLTEKDSYLINQSFRVLYEISHPILEKVNIELIQTI
ncbi:hypothetical protein TRFO_34863 [Tritrichomonas foetus]|uniref:Uncharacterized protein n=1 Tax=Tritrichomonas foetus TaxID=1144522 RepID=A0A1J4JJY8_9EUKA|nr:hypothetical protein TRFO_34863 [Tritrichomonas foetus]|eukprot:OHS98679.1 hypothetical protein TRFO_34863 [Tritrichomonas foetus]